MKATIERAVLLKSLGHVQSVVERRNTIPILSNVLIEADASGQLKLMATDLDLQVVETIAAKVETAGTTTVSAHTLFEIARKLPEGAEVSLAAAEGKMQVKAGRSNFNLPTLPRDDFPVIAEGDLPTNFELPVAELIQIIDKTRFAISTEETRYYLNGIFLHVAEDASGPVLKAAATDGHRLARYTVTRPDGAASMPLNHLSESALSMNRDLRIAVLCAGGYRSSIACSVLEQLGFRNISNVVGGMTAWGNANLAMAS